MLSDLTKPCPLQAEQAQLLQPVFTGQVHHAQQSWSPSNELSPMYQYLACSGGSKLYKVFWKYFFKWELISVSTGLRHGITSKPLQWWREKGQESWCNLPLLQMIINLLVLTVSLRTCAQAPDLAQSYASKKILENCPGNCRSKVSLPWKWAHLWNGKGHTEQNCILISPHSQTESIKEYNLKL